MLLKQQVLLVLASTLSSKVWKSANNCKIRTTAGHSHVYHYQRICINMLFCTETCMKCVWKLFHSKRQCYDKVIVPSEEFSQYPAIMCKMLAVYECIHGYSLLQTVYRPQQITNKCNRLAYIVWWITVAIITLLFVCLVFFFFFSFVCCFLSQHIALNLGEEVFILGEKYYSSPPIVVQHWEKCRHIVLKVWVGPEIVPESCSVTESWNCWGKGDLWRNMYE